MFSEQILAALEARGHNFRRTSQRQGGEYCGPCPWCGGIDRLVLHPSHPEALSQGGLYWCRQCKRGGTGWQLLDQLGLEIPEGMAAGHPRGVSARIDHASKVGNVPNKAWQDRGKMIVDFYATMWGPYSLPLLAARGLTVETAREFKVGFNPKHLTWPREDWGLPPDQDKPLVHLPAGIVLPVYRAQDLIQIGVRCLDSKSNGSRHCKVAGSRSMPAILSWDGLGKRPVLLVESFLDALLVYQEANDLVIAVSLDMAQAHPDPLLHELLRRSPLVLVALDNDSAGDKESGKFIMRYPTARRVKVPGGKDPTGYFAQGGQIRPLIEDWLRWQKGAAARPQASVRVCLNIEDARRELDGLRALRGPVAMDLKTDPPRDDGRDCQDPRLRKPRLITLYASGGPYVALDMAMLAPADLSGLLSGLALVTHDAVEAMAVLRAAGIETQAMDCTLLLANAWQGGRPDFKDAACWVNGCGDVSESEFCVDALEARHILSAAQDCRAIAELWSFLGGKVAETDTGTIYEMMKAAQPAVVDLRLNGMACTPSGEPHDTCDKHRSTLTGRLHPRFKIAEAITGRTSCCTPALQGVSRDPAVRHRFHAPEGRCLVVADYSQINLRIAAHLTGDQELCGMYERGEDAHTRTAAAMTGMTIEALKELPPAELAVLRQRAKPVNFGLLFGLSISGLQSQAKKLYGVDMTQEEATQAYRGFFSLYSGLAAWQEREKRLLASPEGLAVRTPSGRVVRLQAGARNNLFKRLNIQVQGGEAEVLLATLALLGRHLAGLDAKPVHIVHDEIILEASAQDAEAARQGLISAMTEGWLAIFPGAPTKDLVEAKIGPDWAAAK